MAKKKVDEATRRNNQVVATNRKARHNYSILETFEAGVALVGTEVKSLREGSAQLSDAYAVGQHGELFLLNAQIPPYKAAGPLLNHEPKRTRKLLLHRREIDRLYAQVREKGFTLVPTRLYFKDGRVKAEIAVGKGKELRDKRRDVADRDAKRQIERELKSRR